MLLFLCGNGGVLLKKILSADRELLKRYLPIWKRGGGDKFEQYIYFNRMGWYKLNRQQNRKNMIIMFALLIPVVIWFALKLAGCYAPDEKYRSLVQDEIICIWKQKTQIMKNVNILYNQEAKQYADRATKSHFIFVDILYCN